MGVTQTGPEGSSASGCRAQQFPTDLWPGEPLKTVKGAAAATAPAESGGHNETVEAGPIKSSNWSCDIARISHYPPAAPARGAKTGWTRLRRELSANARTTVIVEASPNNRRGTGGITSPCGLSIAYCASWGYGSPGLRRWRDDGHNHGHQQSAKPQPPDRAAARHPG